MKILIVGAGMAGLLAANMLRRHNVRVIERATSLPDNHTALLRFRSPAVSDATGIPFHRQTVRKGLWDGENVVNTPTLVHINRYSYAVTGGELHDRSILNLAPAERWVAPRDFVETMARNVRVDFGVTWGNPMIIAEDTWVISTIPMPFMMDMVGWDKPKFDYLPVWTIKAVIRTPISTVCQTLYNTEANEWYRATIHGQEVTLEYMKEPNHSTAGHEIIKAVWRFLGFGQWLDTAQEPEVNVSTFSINKIPIGKIRPIEEKVRKAFMLYLTDTWHIYSLGRFACWRNILLDDVVQDVKKIEQMMETETTYEMRKA